ncbi:hypothetical protein BegalDRAFT_0937 [Beggiatoa alba B18LD]|uniref:Uncharacterized protein n=1 Tax=Beggiatoa alba B18LD TaxID=395493 RepID=I3CE01_9GAMM|nr:hypothetical protein [Beggiatoa alba]EIJ41844.1 hypothetical protein BegalDRAFT_0937 [Beggiatoa alba B18LD]
MNLPLTTGVLVPEPNTVLTVAEMALYLDLLLTEKAIEALIDKGYLVEDSEGRLIPVEKMR